MLLHDGPTPSSFRVNAFLGEKGVDLPRRWMDVRNGEARSDAFLRLNPFGELPVLQLDDGTGLSETVAICRLIEEMYPEPPLFGRTPQERAVVEMWNRRIELRMVECFLNVAHLSFPFFSGRYEQSPDFAALEARRFDRAWDWFDAALADGRPFVAGESFSIADITGMAVLMICDLAGKAVPAGAAHARRWEEKARARASFGLRVMPEAA